MTNPSSKGRYSYKVQLSINILAVATLIASSIWGLYFMLPGPIKAIYSLCAWTSIALFPYALIQNNVFLRPAKWLLAALILMAILQIVRTALADDAYLYAFGNKWLTLFGNEYTTLLLIPPMFTYLGTLTYAPTILKRTTTFYMVSAIVLSILGKAPVAMLTTFIIVFYPYWSPKYRLCLIIAFIITFIKATTGDNPTRMFLIVMVFAICTHYLVYRLQNIKLQKIFAITIIVTPIIVFVPLLTLTDGEQGTFEIIQHYILQESGDEQMASDTRTFLYKEMSEDLSTNNAWLIGKGAYSVYYSFYFDGGGVGSFGRISSEVPFLTHLLRGGILYVVVYYGLLVYAIYLGVWKGRNKFVKSVALIALGWYFNSFIGDITGFRFYHLAFFLLLGCCLSPWWLNRTDNEIKKLLTNN